MSKPFSSFATSDEARTAFDAFYDYWASLKGGKPAPYKKEFRPTAVPALMPGLALVELIDRTDVVFRLVAAGLRDISRRDYTGDSFFSVLDPKYHENGLKAYLSSADHICGTFHRMKIKFLDGSYHEIDCGYLPLLSDEDNTVRFFILMYVGNDLEDLSYAHKARNVDYDLEDGWFLDVGNGAPAPAQFRFAAG